MTAPRTTNVDIHTHFFPQGLTDVARTTGDERWPSLVVDGAGARIMRGSNVFRPVSPSCFDPSERLAAMDRASIDVHVLSPVPITLVTWAEARLAATFAREQNNALAATASLAPDRFRWFGSVPLQDTDLAIAELTRARELLGMDGVQIGTTVDGRELDDPTLRPFFRAAASLDLPIFVHPVDEQAIRRRDQPFAFGLGMLTDTAMAAGALVFGGVLDDVPDLRVGLAHGCGTFPWAVPRLTRGASLGGRELDEASTAAIVRRLWADTLVFDPAHLGLLVDRFGADHLMLGSDFPFYPPGWGSPEHMLLEACERGICNATERDAMLGQNARLFLSRSHR